MEIVTEVDTEKMSVRLLFPTYLFSRNFLDPNLSEEQGYTLEYNQMLVEEIDNMRRRDPKGRQVSNAETGWQSNDGCESNPVFQKCMNRITRFFQDEVLPFFSIPHQELRMEAGNSWANVNEKNSWNRPHLHNGCWYSGVLYLKADGNEGNFEAIDKDAKVVSDFPSNQRCRTSFALEPRVGDIHLFPSGLMHMVEPNFTDKDRISISFNMNAHQIVNNKIGFGLSNNADDYNMNEFAFELDQNGNPIR